ncbi:hypothetical protein PENSPDRAFT_649507 [Peniophora sp. CONT]|nr:hypothetical protein PENSPDRAFT_649507 [Peniophora sp. CONT]
MAFGGQMFDASMEPPTVPPRKEKRPKQNKKPQPYTQTSPTSPSFPHDKLSRELQRANPYTAESGKSPRPSGQDKLQRERLRALAGAGASGGGIPGPSHPNPSRASLPPSYRSTSPSPTFTSLPPYSSGPPNAQAQTQPQTRDRTQRKSMSLFRRFSRASSRDETVLEEMGPADAESPRALSDNPQSATAEGMERIDEGARAY